MKRPYISESGLKAYLEKVGYSKIKIRKAVDPANGDGLIGSLIRANMISPFEHGWIVIDDTWASAMMMTKEAE